VFFFFFGFFAGEFIGKVATSKILTSLVIIYSLV